MPRRLILGGSPATAVEVISMLKLKNFFSWGGAGLGPAARIAAAIIVSIPVHATAAEAPAAGPGPALLRVDPASPVAERVAAIDRFVHEHYYDAAGLMYSHINWREERPFTAQDFSPTDSTMMGPEPHQWMSYENSPFISGLFLTAQCFRYQATKDPAALEYARRAFGSIDANYRLTEQSDPAGAGLTQRAGYIDAVQARGAQNGFFCKPYYGQATDHTSTEQHFGPLLGLYHYAKLAPPETQRRIKQIFSEVSRRWRGNYRINYFGETWNIEESNPRAQRHMFVWSVIHRLAYELTGEQASLDEFRRLDALFGAIPTPRETAHGLGRPSYVSTEDRSFHVQIVLGAELLAALEPAARGRYLRGMREWYRYSFIGQRDDFASYYFIKVDPMSGAWEKLPASIKPRAHWRTSFMLQNATLPICWLGTRERQAITSAIVARYVPEAAAQARERHDRIYATLSKDYLKWFVDPEGVMPAELRWMLNVMQGDALAFYSLGYWYARANAGATPMPASAAGDSEWRSLASLPDSTGFGGMAGGVLDDQLLVAGGSQWDKPLWAGGKRLLSDRIFTLADPHGAWREEKTRLPYAVGGMPMAADGRAIYGAGGLGNAGTLTSSFKIEPIKGTWSVTPLPALPAPVVYGTGAVANGRFYVIGGLDSIDAKAAKREVWSLPVAGRNAAWRREPDLPDTGLFVTAATGVAGDVYVFGGMAFSANGTATPSKAAYRLRAGKWERLADLPEARVGSCSPCPVIDGHVYVVGGYAEVFPGAPRDHPGFSRETYWYDIAGGTWSAGARLPVTPVTDRDAPGDAGPAPMIGAVAATWRDQIVIVGGEVRASVRTPAVIALPIGRGNAR